ncbi:selenium-binding protein [Methanotorris formicicus]|uniref:Heavy metal-binding domain-containing protein n=1 Tax=Methanotorris formicicus Mc-S-70 TaxID=647171 RepID=H1KZN8_9EURY|nr:selenium-binding protein [Methanotorris formicicus]EHP85779.1 hypothetical protein MetfoDRAFT_1261 [Methanotorris formicicus Mc-S-70]
MKGIMSKEVIITTTYDIPGIELYTLGVISAIVDGIDMENLLKELEEIAQSMDANGIVGFKTIAINEGDSVKLMGYGTAVKFVEGQWAID